MPDQPEPTLAELATWHRASAAELLRDAGTAEELGLSSTARGCRTSAAWHEAAARQLEALAGHDWIEAPDLPAAPDMSEDDLAQGRRRLAAWLRPDTGISDILADIEEELLDWLREHGEALFDRAAEPKLRVRRVERIPFEIEEE